MKPEKVTFTGLELTPDEVMYPRKEFARYYPPEWVRFQFTVENNFGGLRQLDKWLAANILGRWGSYISIFGSEQTFVVVFEQLNDAIMFRLKDGQTEAFKDISR